MPPGLASFLADFVLLVHLGFVVFVVAGALFLPKWPRLAWLHAPAAIYGAAIEFVGWVCPLTPLENRLRRVAGQDGIEGGFIEHYARGVLYPENWSEVHVWLGVAVVLLNVILYGWYLKRRTRRGGGV